MHLGTGLNSEQIWHEFPEACGLHYLALWWQDYAQAKYRLELLFRCITGKGDPQLIEVVSLDAADEEELV